MEVTVEDYTAKSIIVYGEGTRAIKDQLKRLGGRWSRLRLRKNPSMAWILPKKAKSEVEALVGRTSSVMPIPPVVPIPSVLSAPPVSPPVLSAPPVSPPVTPPVVVRLPSKTYSEKDIRKCIKRTSEMTSFPIREIEKIVFEEFPQYQVKVEKQVAQKAKPRKLKPEKLPKIKGINFLLKANPYEIPKLCRLAKFRDLCSKESTWKRLVPESRKPGETWKKAFWRILGFGVSRLYQIKNYELEYIPKERELKSGYDLEEIRVYDGKITYANLGNVNLDEYLKFDKKTGEFAIPEGIRFITIRRDTFSKVFDFEEKATIICPNSLEVMWIDQVPLAGIRFSKKLSLLWAQRCELTSLDMSRASVKYLKVPHNHLARLILPPTGLKVLDVSKNRLRALIVPPGVTNLECRENVFAKVYLKRNKQNQGNENKPSKQEKMLARCTGGEFSSQVRKKRNWGKFKTVFWYKFKNFVWYDKFPSPTEQNAIYDKYAPPEVGILDALPNEVILEIMLRLPYHDIKRLCVSSPRLFGLCQDDELWRTIVQRNLNLPKPVEYYGYKTYYALYRDFHQPVRRWKELGLRIYYLGPDVKAGEGYDKRGHPVFPKGTIAISGFGKITDPDSIRYIRWLPFLSIERLKEVVKTNPRYRSIEEVETLCENEGDKEKIIEIYTQKAGRPLKEGRGNDFREVSRWAYSGPPGPTTISIEPKVLWPGIKWMKAQN